MSGLAPPLSKGEFEASCDDLNTQRDEVIDDFYSFIQTGRNLDFGCLGVFKAGLKEDVDAALAEIEAAVESFIEESIQLLSPGNPFWFYEASERWLDAITDLSSRQFDLGSGRSARLPAHGSWSDNDVRWYAPMPDAQNAAIDEMKRRCQGMASAAQGHSHALTNHWLDLFVKFSELHSWVAKTVGTFISADPTKWLDIVSVVIAALVDLKDLVVAFLVDLARAWADSRDLVLDMKSSFADMAAFDRGRWPSIASYA